MSPATAPARRTVPIIRSDRTPRCILTIFSAVTILRVAPSPVPGVNVNALPPVISLVQLDMCRPPRGVKSPRAQLNAESARCDPLRCRLVQRSSALEACSTRHCRHGFFFFFFGFPPACDAKLVYASLWSFLEFMNVFPEKRNHKFESRQNFSCSVFEEHDESSRMAVSTWVCALSFGRCRMSKFRLLVYLDSYRILRRTLVPTLFLAGLFFLLASRCAAQKT